jgi:tRNA(fMet)-specific endonuclease VapC
MASKKIILCDSNIVIKLFRGDEKVRKKLTIIGTENIALSIITHSEIYVGTKKSELENVKTILNSFKVYHINEETSKIFNGIIINYSISHRITIPDALIAATAISYNLPLYTENIKDFNFIPELSLYKQRSK